MRIADVIFALDQLEALNSNADSPFTGMLNLDSVAVAGHSLGWYHCRGGLQSGFPIPWLYKFRWRAKRRSFFDGGNRQFHLRSHLCFLPKSRSFIQNLSKVLNPHLRVIGLLFMAQLMTVLRMPHCFSHPCYQFRIALIKL